MLHFADLAAQGRLRRLLLVAVPPLLILVVPVIVAAWYGDRLPDRVYVDNFVRYPQYAPTWERWQWQHVFPVLLAEALLVGNFVRFWRWPRPQRAVVAAGFFICTLLISDSVLPVLSLVDVTVPQTRPPLLVVPEVGVAVLMGALGWLLASPLPPRPEVTAAPPPGVPAMALGAKQRAMFVSSIWSVRQLAPAGVLLAFGGLFLDSSWRKSLLLVAWVVFEALQARTTLQIDGYGVTMTFPWLPGARLAVPYKTVCFAEAMPTPPTERVTLTGDRRGWGIVSGKGPVLALALSDGRRFFYSTHDAETGAALVNGCLSRERQVAAGSADHD